MIPKNLTRQDILQAIKEVDATVIPLDRHSTKWSVLYDGKHYPPKYLVSIANIFRNGEEWHQSKFSRGPETNRFHELVTSTKSSKKIPEKLEDSFPLKEFCSWFRSEDLSRFLG